MSIGSPRLTLTPRNAPICHSPFCMAPGATSLTRNKIKQQNIVIQMHFAKKSSRGASISAAGGRLLRRNPQFVVDVEALR